jgi:cholesterol transport system auxiliary component
MKFKHPRKNENYSPNIMKTSHIHFRRITKIFVAFMLACICGLTGCLSRSALNKQTFAFSTFTIAATNILVSNRVLGIRNLQIAAPFEGRSFVYRTGEFSYVRDPYAEFLEPPAEELIAPVRGWLRGNEDFSTVVEAASALKPDTLVEVNVSQLFGDFHQPERPAAILTMRFVFFDATNGVPGKAIFQQEYSRNIPLSIPTATMLMDGWERALSEILAQVSSDFRYLETNAPTGGNK